MASPIAQSVKRFTAGATAVGLLGAGAAGAQDLSLAEWRRARQPNRTATYTHPSGGGVVLVVEEARDLDALVASTRRNAEAQCPGMMAARPVAILQSLASSVRVTYAGQLCSLAYGKPGERSAVVFSVERVSLGLNAAARAEALLRELLGAVASPLSAAPVATGSIAPARDPGVAVPRGQSSVSSTGLPADIAPPSADAPLRQAIASVPAAHLPMLILDRWVMEMVGTNLLRVNKPWLAFGNGYATNCFDWNPATTAPTPATLGNRRDCAIARWQKIGTDRYRILDADGAKEDPLELSQLRPFSSGQRLQIDFDNWDGVSSGTLTGQLIYANVTIRELLLRRDGTIGSSSRNENWDRGTHTTSNGSADGRYLLDGYLMALQQPDGRVTLHFTGYSLNQSRLHIVALDGRMFTKK
jgi:hypothetical protein